MVAATVSREGFVPFHGYKVWYRVVGERDEPGRWPLLVLHGGPGGSHDSVENLSALATGRRVVFYDQLGGGRSDQPDDPALWTLDLFVQEVGVIREALGLDHVHLWGLCWGGIVALSYALRQPAGLHSLTLAGTYASTRQWVAGLERLCLALPPETREAMLGLIHADAAAPALPTGDELVRTMLHRLIFQRRHFCRLRVWPECLSRAQVRRAVFEVMSGPNDFCVSGRLRDWDVVDRLGEITVPTLLTSGRYDHVVPDVVATIQRGVPKAAWAIFEQSAHVAHLEEPALYLRTLEAFLRRVELNHW